MGCDTVHLMLGLGKDMLGMVRNSQNVVRDGTFPDRMSTGINPMCRGLASLVGSTSLLSVRISSPSHYQRVDKAEGTQVDIQSEEKASSDCTTIYKLIRKLLDHVTLLGTWYGP